MTIVSIDSGKGILGFETISSCPYSRLKMSQYSRFDNAVHNTHVTFDNPKELHSA